MKDDNLITQEEYDEYKRLFENERKYNLTSRVVDKLLEDENLDEMICNGRIYSGETFKKIVQQANKELQIDEKCRTIDDMF